LGLPAMYFVPAIAGAIRHRQRISKILKNIPFVLIR